MWLPYALTSLVLFSVYEVLSRVAGLTLKNPRVFSSLYNGLAAILAMGLFLIEPVPTLSLGWYEIGWTLAGLVFWVAFGRLEYYAHKHTEASTMAVLLKLGPVVTFVLSSLVFGEKVTTLKLLGLFLLCMASGVVMRREIRSMTWDKGTLYTLLVSGILGVAWTFDKGISGWYGIGLFTMMSFGVPAIVNALTPVFTRKELHDELKAMGWQVVILASLTATGYGMMMRGLARGEASRVILVSTSTTPLVLLMGALFLGEKKDLKYKTLATLMTVVGIVCLS